MTEPFSAAAVFTNNNNNADGWGDDWGDWGDSNAQAPQQQQQQPHHQPAPQPVPMMPPMGTNQYFQPQQYPPQTTHLDQSNRNFMMNPAQPAYHQNYQQPPMQQNYYQQPPPPQQQQQQFANNYVAQQPQRPPSHPPASTTPQQQQQQSFNHAISDSFDTSGGDTWNWSIGDQQAAAPSPRPAEVVQQPTNYPNYTAPTQNSFSLPGAGNNTQQQPLPPPPAGPKVQVAQLTRLKNETLSPQWSIESQVSQTSSDRSIESGELGDTRSSNTVPSDDGSSGRQGVENYENVGLYPPGADLPDKLDEALNSLSIKQEPQQQEVALVEERRQDGGYRESSFPPPPPSIAGANQQADGAATSLPPKSSSKTPPLPPMPTEASGPPPPMQAGPPPKGPAGNPFKRTGQRAHIATPGLAPAPSTSPAYFYQPPPAPVVQQEIANLENPVPENQEIPDPRADNVENLEIAPSNDRNQYLQTGHLSEEGYTATSQPSNDPQPADDSLPPPGLSRYVPGQQQSEPNPQNNPTHNFPEPPPGLDRMIPGTDLEHADTDDLNMERQVDGEVSDSATSSARPSSHQQQISDRNLYLVPGESDTHHNQQRVIPGVEDDRYAPPQQQPPTSTATADIPINEQTRELVMDGENPHDPPPLHVEISREEPIEGGNTRDDEPIPATSSPSAATAAASAAGDSALAVEPPRKDPSNTSTADESDKERSMFYSKSKQSSSARRDEDPLRRSTKSKSSRDRYDTEDSDYSDRERRRREREGSDGHRDRKRGGGDKEKERRKEGGRGERDRERDRGYDYRDRDRNRYDRERGDRDRYGGRKYDRDSRYETDGSKYETERSTRYDKDGDGSKRYISREEYYRKREERGGGGGGGEDHRRYRKEKDRERGGDRYREEGRKDDRYRDGDKRRDRHDRRYDYEDYRTGSRNGTERDRVRDSRERDDRKDPRDPRSSKYPASASAAYGPQYHPGSAAGYYDPYSYYTQHQQYYEQLRRTNPQAYAEWYRTYYSQMQAHQAAHIPRDIMAGDDRESVHSGRSSANDKERFNRTTPFLHQPPPVMATGVGVGMYNPEDYHRHFNNQSQPSAMLDQSFLSDVSGQPTSLYHHQQQQHQHQMAFQQHQQRATPLIMDRSYHTDSGYYQPRLDATDGSQLEVLEPERLTPRKFPEIHSIVSISSGLLVTAKNRITINGATDFVKILSLGTNEPTRKLFQSYPGPLVKDKTHKKSVIEFCEEQLRQGPPCMAGHTLIKSRGNSINSLHSFGSSVNRGSFTLLWNYIILLLRQNGTFVGTDISELLMQNKVEFPFESVQASARSTNVSGRNSSLSATVERRTAAAHGDAEGAESGQDDSAEQQGAVESAETSGGTDLEVMDGKKEPLSELEITDKFRNYLIYGNIGEALEWATENNLWGHALFLASKVDSRQHANVMMKFANKLTLNDPLQTLYQLLSGRTPSSVTCVLDEKWGDWRPHLAMLMSNSSAKPELIKKSITTLGDSLYNRGDLYGAHFCYLLSDVTFGRFADVKVESGASVTANTVVRLILLGSCHMQRTFKEFSMNESIMMTEIYEYARSLNEERYSITELQYYKYLLASRMLDYGMQLKCLLYMEQLAEQIQLDPYRFDSEFIRKVFTLGDRLKYYDPVLEKELDESVDNHGHGNIYTNVEDPAWLQRLSAILINYNSPNTSNYAPQQTSYDGQPDYSNNTSQYNSYTGYNTEQRPGAGQEQLQQQPYGIDPTEINNEFTKINAQLGQLNLQYTEGFDTQQQQQQQQQQPTPTHNQYDHSMAAPSYDQGYDSINQSSLPEEQKQPESYDQSQQQQQQQPYSYGSYDGSSGQPSLFVPSPVPAGQEQQQQDQQSSPYNYWGANAEMPKPSITMPNAVSSRPGFDDEDGSNASPKHGAQSNQSSAGQQQQQRSAGAADQQPKKGPPAKDAKPGANNQGSGWFGGIWNKLSLKPKNQMILPDDKNPTIVWDPDQKKWVNTEGDAAGEESFKPPPKMADLMPAGAAAAPPPQAPTPGPPAAPAPVMAISAPSPGYGGVAGGMAPTPTMNVDPGASSLPPGSAAAPQGAAPKVGGEPTKVPTLQSNMFKMQRNRTLKKSYVDVFNPSGAAPSRPTESIMAPAVPTMPTPQAGFFVPGPAPAGGQSNESAAEGVPQFYNPNQYAGGYQQ